MGRHAAILFFRFCARASSPKNSTSLIYFFQLISAHFYQFSPKFSPPHSSTSPFFSLIFRGSIFQFSMLRLLASVTEWILAGSVVECAKSELSDSDLYCICSYWLALFSYVQRVILVTAIYTVFLLILAGWVVECAKCDMGYGNEGYRFMKYP